MIIVKTFLFSMILILILNDYENLTAVYHWFDDKNDM